MTAVWIKSLKDGKHDAFQWDGIWIEDNIIHADLRFLGFVGGPDLKPDEKVGRTRLQNLLRRADPPNGYRAAPSTRPPPPHRRLLAGYRLRLAETKTRVTCRPRRRSANGLASTGDTESPSTGAFGSAPRRNRAAPAASPGSRQPQLSGNCLVARIGGSARPSQAASACCTQGSAASAAVSPVSHQSRSTSRRPGDFSIVVSPADSFGLETARLPPPWQRAVRTRGPRHIPAGGTARQMIPPSGALSRGSSCRPTMPAEAAVD